MAANAFQRNIGRRLKKEREAQTLSQNALAEISGVARGQIALIEQGRSGASVHTVRDLCRGLAVPWATLLGPVERR